MDSMHNVFIEACMKHSYKFHVKSLLTDKQVEMVVSDLVTIESFIAWTEAVSHIRVNAEEKSRVFSVTNFGYFSPVF